MKNNKKSKKQNMVVNSVETAERIGRIVFSTNKEVELSKLSTNYRRVLYEEGN